MSLLPQIGFLELMVLAVLALVVVGPKDLPKLMRGIGKFLRQARQMADEFRAGFDQMARESEMAELRNEIEQMKKNNPVAEIKGAVEGAAKDVERDTHTAKPAKSGHGDKLASHRHETPAKALSEEASSGEPSKQAAPGAQTSDEPASTAETADNRS